MKTRYKFIILIILFLTLFTSVSYCYGKEVTDYLNNTYLLILPDDFDLSNGFIYIYTSGWGDELKVLDKGSYYYNDGIYLYLVGTGKQYKKNSSGWYYDSTLSEGSGIRINNAVKLYFETDIYSDKEKTDYFYKMPAEPTPDNPNNPGITLPDLSMNGVLDWLWKQNEELAGLTREQIQQTEEFKEIQRITAERIELQNASIFDVIKKIFDVLNPFSENFFVKTLIKWLGELLEGLFVPDQERFTAIIEVFQRKFAFVDSVKEMINSLDNVISNLGNTPKLSINVHSKYYDGELQTIDLGWFKEFKNYTDLVITGFCYLFFLWRFFVTIPEIIGNRGSMRVAEDSAFKGVSGRK